MQQRAADVVEREVLVLRRRREQGAFGHPLVPLAGEARTPHRRQEQVAHDHEHPCLEVGARPEAVPRAPGVEHRVLDQVVGPVGVARQAAREGAQMGNDLLELAFELGVAERRTLVRRGRGFHQ
jgi:hypothetical protein